jgi:twinkle protein
MISDYTIQQVKERTKVAEVVGDFVQLKRNGSGLQGLCPFHNEKSPSFTIKESENFYKCFGCGESGDSEAFLMKHKGMTYQEAIQHLCTKYKIPFETSNIYSEQKVYSKPKPKIPADFKFDPKIVDWFEKERKISLNTLIKLKINTAKEWMPDGRIKDKVISGERLTIQYNYFRNGELINVKSRDSIKVFKLIKDAELILYNLDSVIGAKECYWVEGENDCAALVEAGILRPGTAVVSVPNGASKTTNNLQYIDNCIDFLEGIEWHYLGFDNDPNGRKLREEIADRLGKEKCKYLEWKDKKDSNDVLINYGIQGVIECCAEKKEFPIKGAFHVSVFRDELKDLYYNGLDMGVGIGIPQIDKQIKYAKGYLTVVTGISSHGKSSFLDQICTLLALNHNWKIAYYSPENRPTKLHLSNIIRKIVGKNWFGEKKLTEQEMQLAANWLEGRFFFIKPEKDFTLKSILDHAKMLKQRFGIDGLVLDSWNKFEHKMGKSAETQYISEQLDLLLNCCEDNKIHCFLVAHPTKQEKDKRDSSGLNYVIPNLYSIAGSAAFFSKADNGMCVYRDYNTGKTKVFIQKVRYSHWGELGYTEWQYDKDSGRFNLDLAGVCQVDKSNWITEKQVQATLEIPDPDSHREAGNNSNDIITNTNLEMPF